MSIAGKNILFLTASFQGYQNEIIRQLENFGANVVWYDERTNNSTLTKIILRTNRNYIKNRISRYYSKILKQNQNKRIDYIFFINIEAATYDIIIKFKHLHPESKLILYEWDSIKNNQNALEALPLFDQVWSFDLEDCKKYGINFLPLFYINEYSLIQPVSRFNKYKFLFIGTIHSDRYKFVKQIEDNNEHISYNWFYFPSRLLYLRMILMDSWFRKKSKYSEFNFTALTKSEVLDLVQQSEIIIDAHHPNQKGLTMRCIEAIGAHRKLITTNTHIAEYDFYNPNNILIVDRNSPIISEEFLRNPYEDIRVDIYEKYSLRNWLLTIFEKKEKNYFRSKY